jgi:hypothetical protein
MTASLANTLVAETFAMTKEDDLPAVIDLIYEAVLDETLWPIALARLADAMGTAQIGLLSLDRRARTYDSIAPRTDPVMDAIFKKYWAFHNPLWPRTIGRPVGEVFLLDGLIPRKDFAATPFFNEWMLPAGFSIASMGANLLVGNEISTMISVANALCVTVTPLRVKGTVAELPWLGLQIPVAIVTVSAPSTEKSLN